MPNSSRSIITAVLPSLLLVVLAVLGVQPLPPMAAVAGCALAAFSVLVRRVPLAPAAVALAALATPAPGAAPLVAAVFIVAYAFISRRDSQVLAGFAVPAAAVLLCSWFTYSATVLALVAAVLTSGAALAAFYAQSHNSTTASLLCAITASVLLVSLPVIAATESNAPVAGAAFAAALVLLFSSLIGLRFESGLLRTLGGLGAAAMLALPIAFLTPAVAAGPVRGDVGVFATGMDECPKLLGDTIASVECYSQVLVDEYRSNSLESAIALVKSSFDAPSPLGPHFANNCHESLHFLAKAVALQSPGEDLRETIKRGTDMCAAGFGHGVWEMQYSLMSTEDLVEAAPTICRGWEGYSRSDEGSFGIGCRHILGHTMATRYRGHVADVAATCLIRDPLADPVSELNQEEIISRNNCLAGLFMENFLDLSRNRQGDIDSLDPYATCEDPKVAGNLDILWGCYNEIGAMVLPFYNNDAKAAYESCKAQQDELGVPQYIVESCYDSMARSLGPTLEYEDVAMVGSCSPLGSGEIHAYCVRGAAAAVAFNSNSIERGNEICRQNVSGEWLDICLARIEEIREALDASVLE
jgi:hypothetical protein